MNATPAPTRSRSWRREPGRRLQATRRWPHRPPHHLGRSRSTSRRAHDDQRLGGDDTITVLPASPRPVRAHAQRRTAPTRSPAATTRPHHRLRRGRRQARRRRRRRPRRRRRARRLHEVATADTHRLEQRRAADTMTATPPGPVSHGAARTRVSRSPRTPGARGSPHQPRPFTSHSARGARRRGLGGDDTFAAAAGTGARWRDADGGSFNDTLTARTMRTVRGGSARLATGGAGPDARRPGRTTLAARTARAPRARGTGTDSAQTAIRGRRGRRGRDPRALPARPRRTRRPPRPCAPRATARSAARASTRLAIALPRAAAAPGP